MKLLSFNPLIFEVDNFISEELCEKFIEKARGKTSRAKVSGKNGGEVSQQRTNTPLVTRITCESSSGKYENP